MYDSVRSLRPLGSSRLCPSGPLGPTALRHRPISQPVLGVIPNTILGIKSRRLIDFKFQSVSHQLINDLPASIVWTETVPVLLGTPHTCIKSGSTLDEVGNNWRANPATTRYSRLLTYLKSCIALFLWREYRVAGHYYPLHLTASRIARQILCVTRRNTQATSLNSKFSIRLQGLRTVTGYMFISQDCYLGVLYFMVTAFPKCRYKLSA